MYQTVVKIGFDVVLVDISCPCESMSTIPLIILYNSVTLMLFLRFSRVSHWR